MMKVSVVVPVHNESLILEDTVSSLHGMLSARFRDYEIVLVENGSTDGTKSMCESFALAAGNVTALSLSAGDYGLALRHGVTESEHDKIIVFDADLYSGDFLDDVLRLLAAEADIAVIVASKRNKGSFDSRSAYRKLGTLLLNVLMRAAFGLKVSDTHGMKFLDRGALGDELNATREAGSLYDTALILRAERNGKKVREVPCTVREMRPPRTKYAIRALQTLYYLGKLRVRIMGEKRSPAADL